MVYNVVPINTSKRWPIVLCLDTSSQMLANQEDLNGVIKTLLAEIQKDVKVKNCAEILLITYGNDIVVHGDFENARFWTDKNVSISSNGIDQTIKTILRVVEIIEERLDNLDDCEIEHYPPLLIVVTKLSEETFTSITSNEYSKFVAEVKSKMNAPNKITVCLVDLDNSKTTCVIPREVEAQIVVLRNEEPQIHIKRILNDFIEIICGDMPNNDEAIVTYYDRIISNIRDKNNVFSLQFKRFQ